MGAALTVDPAVGEGSDYSLVVGDTPCGRGLFGDLEMDG